MSMLRDLEKAIYPIFKVSDGDANFTISVTNLYGNKNSDDERLDPIWIKSYDSSKYSNRSKLKEVQFDPKVFLVFDYVNFEDKDNVVRETIYTSYPDLNNVYDFFDNINDIIFGETSEKVFRVKKKKLTINEDYSELVIQSGELGNNGNEMRAVPVIIENDETHSEEKGITLFINDDENFVTIGEKALYTLFTKMSEFNLTTISQNLYIMSMLALIESVGGESSESGSGRKLARRATVPPRRGSSGFSNRKTNNRSKDKVEMEDNGDDDLDFSGEEDDEEEVTTKRKPAPKGKAKKTAKKSSSTTKKKPKPVRKEIEEDEEDDEESASFKELMDAADEIEYDEDDELEFDE